MTPNAIYEPIHKTINCGLHLDEDNNSSNVQSESMVESDNESELAHIAHASNPNVEASATATNESDNVECDPDESFLDDDFLSFDRVENGGNNQEHDIYGRNSNGANSGDARINNQGDLPPSALDFANGALAQQPYSGQSQADNVRSNNNGNGNGIGNNSFDNPNKRIIPWLDDTNNFSQHPESLHSDQQNHYSTQSKQQSRNRNYNASTRGYSGDWTNNGGNPYYQRPPPPPIIKLHNEIVSFVNLMSPTKEELRMRDVIVKRVTDLAHRVFGGEDKVCSIVFISSMAFLGLYNHLCTFTLTSINFDGKSIFCNGEHSASFFHLDRK